MKIVLLLIVCYCMPYMESVAQPQSAGILTDVYLIDTVEIKDPVLIRFTERFRPTDIDSTGIKHILVSRDYLDSVCKQKTSFLDFLSNKNGYLFYDPGAFSCIVDNLFYYQPSLEKIRLYKQLREDLRHFAKVPVWVLTDKENYTPKIYCGWEYEEIYQRKFLVLLVKGSALPACQSIDEIIIQGMDNVYFRVLVPLAK